MLPRPRAAMGCRGQSWKVLEGVGRFKKIKQKIFKDSQPDRLQMGSRWAPDGLQDPMSFLPAGPSSSCQFLFVHPLRNVRSLVDLQTKQ